MSRDPMPRSPEDGRAGAVALRGPGTGDVGTISNSALLAGSATHSAPRAATADPAFRSFNGWPSGRPSRGSIRESESAPGKFGPDAANAHNALAVTIS